MMEMLGHAKQLAITFCDNIINLHGNKAILWANADLFIVVGLEYMRLSMRFYACTFTGQEIC